MNENHRPAPEALLLIAPGCIHCGGNLAALTTLVKEGAVGRLEVVNIAEHPQPAAALGVRSVPWTRIGEFVLPGARSEAELRQWAGRAKEPNGLAEYFRELLGDGQLAQVQAMVQTDPGKLQALLPLLGDPQTGINVRVGIGALLEDMQGSEAAASLVPGLAKLRDADDSRTRQDVCHYLELTGAPEALPLLQRCLQDPDPLVREIAAEALEQMEAE